MLEGPEAADKRFGPLSLLQGLGSRLHHDSRESLELKSKSAIAFVVLILGLAGCSSAASKNEYVETVNRIQMSVIEATASLSAATVSSPKDALAAFEKAEARIDEAVSELNEIDVPPEAEEGHDELVEGFEDLGDLIRDVQAQVKSGGGRAAFQDLKSEGAKIDARIAKAIDEINAELGAEG